MYFGRTIFAADKIFIGLFSCFRLRQKESQMEIVSDHLCHFQSKSLSAFRRNVRNQICFSRSIWMVLLFLVEVNILIFFGYNDFHTVQFTALIRKKVEIYSQDLTQSNFGASDNLLSKKWHFCQCVCMYTINHTASLLGELWKWVPLSLLVTAEPCDCGVFYRAPERKKKLLRIESKLWKTNIPRKVVKLFPIILLCRSGGARYG